MKSKTNISVRNNLGQRVTSNMILGESGIYPSGTILDANATEKLIDSSTPDVSNLQEITTLREDVAALQRSISNIQTLITADTELVDVAIDKFEEIVDFLDGIEPGSELYNIILSHVDSGESGTVKHIEVLTQQLYEDLPTKDTNTEYNII